MIGINEKIETHSSWLDKMGWLKDTSILEKIVLVYSEIGEAANETRYENIKDEFGKELADIALRIFGICKMMDVGLEVEEKYLKTIQFEYVNENKTHLEQMAEIIIAFDKAIKMAFLEMYEEENKNEWINVLAKTLTKTAKVAENAGFSLETNINQKMLKNLENGTKGRIK